MLAPAGVGEGDALGVPDGAADPVTSVFEAATSALRLPPPGSAPVEGTGLGVSLGVGEGEGVGEGDGVAAACAPFFLFFVVLGAGEGVGVAGGTLKRSTHEYPSIVDGHLNPVSASLIA